MCQWILLFQKKNSNEILFDPIRVEKPDFDLFTNYEKFMKQHPDADFHLIDPRSLWKLWEVLQDFSNTEIRRNPPSSGFIGNLAKQ